MIFAIPVGDELSLLPFDFLKNVSVFFPNRFVSHFSELFLENIYVSLDVARGNRCRIFAQHVTILSLALGVEKGDMLLFLLLAFILFL